MKPRTMQSIRRYHLYLGMFFAPAILLFSLSGALQTFRLQEEKGWGSEPPAWINWIATIHKDSRLPKAKLPETHEDEGEQKAPAPKRAPRPPEANPPFKLPMQIFVVLLSIALIVSTVLGILIALNNRAVRRMSFIMLGVGTVLPLALLLL